MSVPETPTDDLSPKARAVLEAALAAFSARGYHGTNIPDVAAAADVGVGTVYRHFGDKQGLVNAVLLRAWRSMAGAFQAIPGDLPTRTWHRTMFGHVVRWMRDNPEDARFVELHTHLDYLQPEVAAVKRAIVERGRERVAGYIAAGGLKPLPPQLLVSIIWGIMVELLRASQAGYLTLDDATIDRAEQCCWEAVRI